MEKNKIYKDRVEYKQRYADERAIARYRKDEVLSILLDSSLIFQTNKKFVSVKVIECGDYRHVYYYKNFSQKKDKDLELFNDIGNSLYKINRFKDYSYKKIGVINDYILYDRFNFYLFEYFGLLKDYSSIDYLRLLYMKIKKKQLELHLDKINNNLKSIDLKNISRSKFELQRLAKCNESEFKTFITLTFADNITELEDANKQFNIWRTYIKKLKNDFKCLGVPEFQKRGAIHYHLLTNIDYNDFNILSQEEIKIWNKESRSWQIGRNVKGWKYGINMAKILDNIDVVAYITKYMTKDIDNRLWGKRRYFYTRNLKKPHIYEIDLSNLREFQLFVDLLENHSDINFENSYIDFLGNEVNFYEYKKT